MPDRMGDDRQFRLLNMLVDFIREGLARKANVPCPPNG